MAKLGFTILPGTHPICPVMLGGAALADALLFPIAALDGLLYWFCHLGNVVAIEFAPGSGLFRKETLVLPAAIFMWLVIDTLLIWLAWRAANQPVAGQPIAPP